MTDFKIPKDIIILPEENNTWVIMNVFTKTCLGVDNQFFEFFRDLENLSEQEFKKKFSMETFSVWDIHKFSNEEGLLVDPTQYIRKHKEWPQKKEMNSEDLIQSLKKYFLIIEDEGKYRSKFNRKKSLLDYQNFGNFHDQLGQHLMLNLHKSPEIWWVKQKFNDDLKSIRNNLYGAIQAKYLEKYFKKKFHADNNILDIGCGIGFYSNLMAKTGASVTGIDPNSEYIKIAKKNAVAGANFENLEIGNIGALDKIPSESADYIFLSDALLFYFVSPKIDKKPDLSILFSDIKRILKPDGIFINVEPHYIFWLLPWLGEIENPYTVITEYNEKKFGVTATMSALIQAYARGGFKITWMEELTPDESYMFVDLRSYYFAKQFPLWQLFELTKK